MESQPVTSTDQEWMALSVGNTSTWTFDLADWNRGDIAVGMVFDPRPEEGQILSTLVLRARAFSTRRAVTRLEFDKTVENHGYRGVATALGSSIALNAYWSRSRC
jgi:hypothetical protein